MTKIWKVLAAVVTAVVVAMTGALVLWRYNTTPGLVVGVLLVLLGVAIALPIQLRTGILSLKENAVTVIPVVVGAIRGGKRATDPPQDGTGVTVPTTLSAETLQTQPEETP